MPEDEPALSNRTREYPAWGFLLLGAIFATGFAWLGLMDLGEDVRRPLLPWFGAAFGLLLLGKGVHEGWRNRSLVARRAKSEDEQAEEAQEARRDLDRHAMIRRVGLVVGLAAVALIAVFRLIA